jgi:nitroreductase
MADILDLIKSRRNVKHFLPKFISWEKTSRIIDAGRHAPSCGNLQNWKFIVCFDPEQKRQLAEAAHEQYDIAQAGILILVCGEPHKAERYYGLRGDRLYTIQNCAAAVQNMLLEAHSLGLGGTWVGAFDEEAVKTLFGIPEEVRPQAIVAIGHPKEIPPKPAKYPLEVVTYFGGWRSKLRDPAKYMNDIATILARKAANTRAAVQSSTQLVVDKAKEVLKKKR